MVSIKIPNFARKELTKTQFQRRCNRLLRQKLVRFTEEEKQEIKTISKNLNIADGFKHLTDFLGRKYENIQNTSYTIFEYGKTRANGKIIPGFFTRLSTERKKLLITPERAADISDKITNYKEKVLRFFSNIVYKPSTHPDILKIEQNLSKEGIKAKFSDRSSLDFAKLTQETLQEINKQGYDLPKRIYTSPFLGITTKAVVMMKPNNTAKAIFFNPTFIEKTLKSIENYMVGKYLNGIFSTENPKHIIKHEVGHYNHSQKGLKSLYLQYFSGIASSRESNTVLTKDMEQLLKKNVSEFATNDDKLGLDAVAEIFAGLLDGKIYKSQIMDIYKKLNGPMPKSTKN
ncbi:MAG TPA: hypothetical protein DDW90_11895 [Cyanobacteria bacterium UBA9971]|nr:hypothetical protein [Cyanobacteria bacterium UBA9971]